jgi:UDP-hydrolysing UDP-N-acetyl-D-glucosamine 2-epimerase
MALKILAVTGSRADWGLISPVLMALKHDTAFELKLAVTGQHLMGGADQDVITSDGFEIDVRVDLGLDKSDDQVAITKALGRAVSGFSNTIQNLKPDLMLVLGDRYEIFGAVQAALVARIPVAHICGGDVTEGAIDDAIRHAMTKMSHIHFVTNREAKLRIIRMGENPSCVHLVGSPGLDQVHQVPHMTRENFFKSIDFMPREKNVLITFHSVTLEENSQEQCNEMLAALENFNDLGLIFTGSNADPEGVTLTHMVRDFAAKKANACFHESLGTHRYCNALRHCNAMIGNSSSGLYEAPSFGLPVVNIGNRQRGRLKAVNVIDCEPQRKKIQSAIEVSLTARFDKIENPYGDGRTAARIVSILKNIKNHSTLIHKSFYEENL